MKLKFGQLIEIKWVDCFGSNGWEDLEPLPSPPTITSVGYFLKTEHRGVYIASGIPLEEMDGKCLAPTWIPLGCVLKIRRLK